MKLFWKFAIANVLLLAAVPLAVYWTHSTVEMSSYTRGDIDVFVHTEHHFIFLGHSSMSGWKFSAEKEGPMPPILHLTRRQFADKLINGPRLMSTGGEQIIDDDVAYWQFVEYPDEPKKETKP